MAPRIMYSPAPRKFFRSERRPWAEFQWPAALVIGGLHAGALAGIVWHVLRHDLPHPAILWTALAFYVITGFGVTAGYHRLFTHESFDTSDAVKAVLLVAGGLSLEGPVRTWVPTHWYHHERSDQPGDPHSPYQYAGLKGVLWAHVGWMFYTRHQPISVGDKRQALLDSHLWRLQERYYWVLAVATFALPVLIGGWVGGFTGAVDGLLVAGFARIVFILHITWCINSICHVIGRHVSVHFRTPSGAVRVRTQGDNSRNIWWLGLPTFGESYHALHHLYEKVGFHGWGRWDLDPSKWLIIAAERLGLVWDVERPPANSVVDYDPARLPPDTLIPASRRSRVEAAT